MLFIKRSMIDAGSLFLFTYYSLGIVIIIIIIIIISNSNSMITYYLLLITYYLFD